MPDEKITVSEDEFRDREHYELMAELLDHLAQKHQELAELLAATTNPKHAEGDHALAEAERTSAETCDRVAAAIRTRLTER
jgi:uncharacterized membrane-anchored protein YhcB (DUF1043 family)